MIVKVCGITNEEQLVDLIEFGVDMVGLNFYPESKRFISEPILSPMAITKRVGVFVNPSPEEIALKIFEHKLDMIQLHGDESPEFCLQVAEQRPVIKAFGVNEVFSFDKVKDFTNCADYFLFDNKTPGYGGSGNKFDWGKLMEYKGKIPFLLSGGIKPNDISEILKINHPALAGIDINSGFESRPGIKDLNAIKEMMKLIRR